MERSQAKALARFGIKPGEFWLMEVRELNQALEEWDSERRERIEQWRFSNYVNAAPYFDDKKPRPSIEDWYPLPWDKNKKGRVEFMPYDERIALFIKKGKQDWIPNQWFERSENYKHLCKPKSKSKG